MSIRTWVLIVLRESLHLALSYCLRSDTIAGAALNIIRVSGRAITVSDSTQATESQIKLADHPTSTN